jgi:hypothetical protein
MRCWLGWPTIKINTISSLATAPLLQNSQLFRKSPNQQPSPLVRCSTAVAPAPETDFKENPMGLFNKLQRVAVQNSLRSSKTGLIITAIGCCVVGFLCGLFLDAENQHITSKLQLITRHPEQQSYTVFSSKVWHSTVWGRNCSEGVRVDKGLDLLCQLPSIWQDCSAGIYIDVVSATAGLLQAADKCSCQPWACARMQLSY